MLVFFEHVRNLIDEKQLRLIMSDAVVITEKPQLGPLFRRSRGGWQSAERECRKMHLKAKRTGRGRVGRGELLRRMWWRH